LVIVKVIGPAANAARMLVGGANGIRPCLPQAGPIFSTKKPPSEAF